MRSVRTIATVAVNVFRESVRDKVLYNLVAFAVLLMAASYLIGQLTAGQDIKIIKDLGLAAIATFGLMIAVFIGIGLVWKEVERRSIYALLSKPLSRAEFIVGKYCGLGLTLVVNVTVMVVRPSAVDCEEIYSMFSTPLISCSRGAATVAETVSALAPGYDAVTVML